MASLIPQALVAINMLMTSALPGWQIVDGPAYDTTKSLVGYVGFTGNPDEPAVTFPRSPVDASMQQFRESVDVACLLMARNGSASLPDVRATLFGAFDAVNTAIAADPTLGDLVSAAFASLGQLLQGRSETGRAADLPFTIHFDAWN